MPLPDAILDLIADEGLKSDPAIKDYNDLGSLVKSHIEMGKTLGTSVRIPGQDAKPEDVHSFHMKLGKPEAAEKYQYAGPENLAERFQTDEQMITDFRKIAFENHFTPSQFKAATDFYNGILTKSADGFPTSENTEKLLQGEWKDKYEDNMGSARKGVAFAESKIPGMTEWLDESGFGDLPQMARLFSLFGQGLGESQVPLGAPSGEAGVNQAKEKIAAVYNDKTHAYHDRNNVNHKQAVEDMRKLFQLAHGEEVQFTTAR